MGKCKFQQKWLEEEQFKSWLKPVDGQPGFAFCTVCKKNVQLCTMGVNALKSHMQSEKHKSAFKGRQQLTVSNFFGVSTTSAVTNTPAAAAATATSSNVCLSGCPQQSRDSGEDHRPASGTGLESDFGSGGALVS